MANLVANANTALEAHLLAAADYVTEVLVRNQVSYALMGGLSLRLRGSSRGTHDVDIVVGCDMNRLLEVIRPLERLVLASFLFDTKRKEKRSSDVCRIRRPAGPTAGVMRVFVTVGGDANPTITKQIVGVDFILQGKYKVILHQKGPNYPADAYEKAHLERLMTCPLHRTPPFPQLLLPASGSSCF